jgi:hypothetical protein
MVEMRWRRCDAGDAMRETRCWWCDGMGAKEKRDRWTLSTGISALGLPLRTEHIQLDVTRPSSMPHNLSGRGDYLSLRITFAPVLGRRGRTRLPRSGGLDWRGAGGRRNVPDPDAVIGRRRRHPTSERARPEIVHVKTVFA